LRSLGGLEREAACFIRTEVDRELNVRITGKAYADFGGALERACIARIGKDELNLGAGSLYLSYYRQRSFPRAANACGLRPDGRHDSRNSQQNDCVSKRLHKRISPTSVIQGPVVPNICHAYLAPV